MEKEIFDKMVELDSYHWWFYGQNQWLKQFYSAYRGKSKKWLDVGCGVSGTLKILEDSFSVFGLDCNDLALSYSKKRGLKNIIKGDAVNIPFKNESFDFVSLLGVMYHEGIKDDHLCIEECKRVCKKGGTLFFSEPVLDLKDSHSIKEQTKRLYTLKKIKDLIEGLGLKIEKITYFNFFAFLPIFLIRKLKNIIKNENDDLARPNIIINSLMKVLMSFESIWIKHFCLPIGSSIICVARKID